MSKNRRNKYKNKKRSCSMCKPHKRKYERFFSHKHREKLRLMDEEISKAA